jgi:hypothetical protein
MPSRDRCPRLSRLLTIPPAAAAAAVAAADAADEVGFGVMHCRWRGPPDSVLFPFLGSEWQLPLGSAMTPMMSMMYNSRHGSTWTPPRTRTTEWGPAPGMCLNAQTRQLPLSFPHRLGGWRHETFFTRSRIHSHISTPNCIISGQCTGPDNEIESDRWYETGSTDSSDFAVLLPRELLDVTSTANLSKKSSLLSARSRAPTEWDASRARRSMASSLALLPV